MVFFKVTHKYQSIRIRVVETSLLYFSNIGLGVYNEMIHVASTSFSTFFRIPYFYIFHIFHISCILSGNAL